MADPLYHPNAFIRNNIKTQVDECLWLSELREAFEASHARKLDNGDEERCSVCTLAFGSCAHTNSWLIQHASIGVIQNELEEEIDDVLNVLGAAEKVVNTTVEDSPVDLANMRWVPMEVRLSDKIDSTDVSLSTPVERGWQSCVRLDKFLVHFGGVSFREGSVPQPFGSFAASKDITYWSDTLLYDLNDTSWHTVAALDSSPIGRFGHIAAELPFNKMLLFGGRGEGGQLLADTWVFDLASHSWFFVDVSVRGVGASPPPRVFAACATAGNDVFVFGGTDGAENFCDLWVFRGHPSAMIWERAVPVGLPPSPRYGHRMVTVADPVVSGRMTIAVLGGCEVSPASETATGGAKSGELGGTLEDVKTLFDLGKQAEKNYLDEGKVVGLLGQSLESQSEAAHERVPGAVKELQKQASTVAGIIAFKEQETRNTELELLSAWQRSQIHQMSASRQAKHPTPHVDVVFLDPQEMTWLPKAKPFVSGPAPTCRMHFGAVCLAGNILVFGGIQPTSVKYTLVEKEETQVYRLEASRMKWMVCRPTDSSLLHESLLNIAEADIIRAKQRCDAEKFRGLSLGAKNGRTVELVEAEALLNVCNWRKNRLSKEGANYDRPPTPRWGMSSLVVGQRAFLLGGWERHSAVGKKSSVILEMEAPHERTRRLADEFSARLERERKIEEDRAVLNDVLTAAELREKILAEKANEERERRHMISEEILSALPPLSKPKPVRFVKSNEHTIWVSWERMTMKTNYQVVDPSTVTYMLYMRGGFQRILKGDRVVVAPSTLPATLALSPDRSVGDSSLFPPTPASSNGSSASSFSPSQSSKKSRRDQTRRSALFGSSTQGAEANPPYTYFTLYNHEVKLPYKLFPGEVSACDSKGKFDIAYDDGTVEKNVIRARLRLDPRHHPQHPLDPRIVQSILRSEPAAVVKRRMIEAKKKKTRHRESMGRFNPALLPKPVSTARSSRGTARSRASAASKSGTPTKPGTPSKPGTPGSTDSRPTSRVMIRTDSEGSEPIDSDDEKLKQQSQLEEADSDFEEHCTVNEKIARRLEGKNERDVTIVPTDEWVLVYSGNDTSYACVGLVPDEVLLSENEYTCRASFCVQTIGLEFPAFERSQMSDVVEFMTRRTTKEDTSKLTRALSMRFDLDNDESLALTGSTASGMISRRKKEVFTAVIRGNTTVQLERQYDTIIGRGTFDDFV